MVMTMIQLRTGRLTRTCLIENYARVVKENGCGALNTNNTMENTLKMLHTGSMYCAYFIEFHVFCQEIIDTNDIYLYIYANKTYVYVFSYRKSY